MLKGRVISGDKIGLTLGFPTANINISPEDTGLAQGVYAATVLVRDVSHYGALVINTRHNKVEVFIIGFGETIYDEKISIDPKKKVSDLISYSSAKEIKQKIRNDIEKVKDFFKI